MKDIDYEQKYLKYKSKYLELKNQVENLPKNNTQVGGFSYTQGQYVFFIPESKAHIVDSVGDDKIIENLDIFTTKLDNCTKFVRIGTIVSGSTDAIYTNQNSTGIVGRTIKGISESIQKMRNNTEQVNKQINQYNSSLSSGIQCNNNPIRLCHLTQFQSINDVTKDNLQKYIEKINKRQPAQKIKRIIIVEKKGLLSLSKVHLLDDFIIDYIDDGEIKVSKTPKNS